jgi:hypothetical protein
VDPVPDPLLFFSGSAGKRTRASGSVAKTLTTRPQRRSFIHVMNLEKQTHEKNALTALYDYLYYCSSSYYYYYWLYSPFLGPGYFFSFLILYTEGSAPCTGDQPVARTQPTQGITNIINTYIHTYMHRVEFES